MVKRRLGEAVKEKQTTDYTKPTCDYLRVEESLLLLLLLLRLLLFIIQGGSQWLISLAFTSCQK